MSEKYAFIVAERSDTNATAVADAPTIAQMCARLSVSKSGFYDWLHCPPSPAQQRRELLKAKIAALFETFGGVYGYRRIHAELRRAGEQIDCEGPGADAPAGSGLCPAQAVSCHHCARAGRADTADLVQRDLSAAAPWTKLVGEIICIPTWRGWPYLVTVIDCFDNDMISHAMASHMRTELVTDALAAAARNHPLEGCIMHSESR